MRFLALLACLALAWLIVYLLMTSPLASAAVAAAAWLVCVVYMWRV